MSKRVIRSLFEPSDGAVSAARFQRLAPQLAHYPNLPTATTEIILDAFSAASATGFPELPPGEDSWCTMPAERTLSAGQAVTVPRKH